MLIDSLYSQLYYWFLGLHIMAAAVWVGGAVVIQILASLMLKSPSPGRKAEFARDAGWVGERIFAPVSILLLLLGFGLMWKGSWDWGDIWVIIALLGWAATFVVGLFVISPIAKQIPKTIQQTGPDSPETSALIDRVLVISRVDLAVLVLVIFDMTLKPGL